MPSHCRNYREALEVKHHNNENPLMFPRIMPHLLKIFLDLVTGMVFNLVSFEANGYVLICLTATCFTDILAPVTSWRMGQLQSLAKESSLDKYSTVTYRIFSF